MKVEKVSWNAGAKKRAIHEDEKPSDSNWLDSKKLNGKKGMILTNESLILF